MTVHVTNYRKKQGVKTESVSPEYICQETGQKSNGKASFFPLINPNEEVTIINRLGLIVANANL